MVASKLANKNSADLRIKRSILIPLVSGLFTPKSAVNITVTHCYFITPDKECFLRVHQPERHGDIITRFTLDQAIRNNEVASDIELGPLGTFTLCVVKPWLINGQLAGYLELGREIEFLTGELKKVTT